VALGLAGSSFALAFVGVCFWGLSFSGAPTLLQTALADASADASDIAQSMLVTVFNLSFAGSGLLGGVLLGTVGSAVFPWLLASLACAAALVAWCFRATAFPRVEG